MAASFRKVRVVLRTFRPVAVLGLNISCSGKLTAAPVWPYIKTLYVGWVGCLGDEEGGGLL